MGDLGDLRSPVGLGLLRATESKQRYTDKSASICGSKDISFGINAPSEPGLTRAHTCHSKGNASGGFWDL